MADKHSKWSAAGHRTSVSFCQADPRTEADTSECTDALLRLKSGYGVGPCHATSVGLSRNCHGSRGFPLPYPACSSAG